MDNKQLKLMTDLAKKLKEEKRDNADVLKSFVSAGILTASGNYTKNYAELKRNEEVSKTR